MSAEVNHTYEIYVHDDRYAVPTLHFAEAADDRAALQIARRLMDESPHHQGVELCHKGERLIGLGALAPDRGRNSV